MKNGVSIHDSWFVKTWFGIRSWFRYTFNKEHINLVKEAFNGRPYDHGFLLDLEYAKIKEMKAYHERVRRFEGVEYVIRDMGICLSLIEIFTGKRNLFEYEGNLEFVDADPKYGLDENGKPFKEIKPGTLKFNCKVHVNTKNANRFLPKDISEDLRNYWLKNPDEIYTAKARYLYHKIRAEREEEWWD